MRYCPSLWLTLLILLPWSLRGQPVASERKDSSIFDRMAAIGGLRLELVTDLDSIEVDRYDQSYQTATLTISGEGHPAESWTVEVRNRARFRRRVCDFPPIKIKFPKKALKTAGLAKHNELKLVTHCMKRREGDENLREEFFIYKLYETLSRVHYRAARVEVTYTDRNSGRSLQRPGILLEDEEELADRFQSTLCEDCFGTPDTAFDQANLQVQSLFQYMIGNSDWNPLMLRNVKLLMPEDGGKYFLVPYDFDYCGLVDASYAVPDGSLGIRTIRERIMLGPFDYAEELEPAIELFEERRQALFEFLESFPYLEDREKRAIARYLESYYKDIRKFPKLAKR